MSAAASAVVVVVVVVVEDINLLVLMTDTKKMETIFLNPVAAECQQDSTLQLIYKLPSFQCNTTSISFSFMLQLVLTNFPLVYGK